MGAWCYMHAQFHRSRTAGWRLWYLAALVLFPWDVSRGRIKGSSVLARLRLLPRMDDIGLIGGTRAHAVAPYADEEARGLGLTARAPIGRVIVLNCYGRGGSGMVWRMIGSSPDVIMTSEEWHVGAFGKRKTLRKGLLLAFRSLGIRSIEPLGRYALQEDARNAEAERRDQ